MPDRRRSAASALARTRTTAKWGALGARKTESGNWELCKWKVRVLGDVAVRRPFESPLRPAFSNAVRLDNDFVTPVIPRSAEETAEVPRPRDGNACRLSRRLGLASPLFARHYSGDDIFSCGILRCFSVLRVPFYPVYIFNREYLDIPPGGLPHSEIPGSSDLLAANPGFIATTLRPSSALGAKASTVCPW